MDFLLVLPDCAFATEGYTQDDVFNKVVGIQKPLSKYKYLLNHYFFYRY